MRDGGGGDGTRSAVSGQRAVTVTVTVTVTRNFNCRKGCRESHSPRKSTYRADGLSVSLSTHAVTQTVNTATKLQALDSRV